MTSGYTPRHDALERIRASRTAEPISDLTVQAAFDEVQASGVLPILNQIALHDRGRPRLLTPAGLFTAMTLCSDLHDGAVRFNVVTDILHWRISEHWRTRFHIKDRCDDDRGFEAGYRVVLRLVHDILDALDPSVLPKNHRLPKTEAAALLAAADADLVAERRKLLDIVANGVLESSVAPVRPDLDGPAWDGSVSVDATVIATFAKGVRASADYLATDPDAGWYVREGDHRDPDDVTETVAAAARPTAKEKPARGGTKESNKKKRRARKYVFGYDATFVVARDVAGGATGAPRLPALVIAISLGRPGTEPGERAVDALADAVLRRRYKTGFLAGDRAYNNSEPETFQLPAKVLGYKAVFDYRVDQLGIAAQVHGAIQVEGTWYSPSMPTPLIDATADLLAGQIDQTEWLERIEARRPYALVPKEHPDADGYQRFLCPAAAGKLQCSAKPESLGAGVHLVLTSPPPSPVDPQKVCAQASITIPPDVGAKHAQALPYGTKTWSDTYFGLRNAVEGFNGFAKDSNHEDIEDAGRRRIRGIAAQTILLAFQLAHANKRKIAAWADTLPDPQTGRPRRRPASRRATTLKTWTPTGRIETHEGQAA